MFVSDENKYISGELFVTEDGYNLALMYPHDSSTSTCTISLVEDDSVREQYVLRPGETAVLHVTSPSWQTVKAIIQNGRKTAKSIEYRLDEIDGISDGMLLSDYTADQTFEKP